MPDPIDNTSTNTSTKGGQLNPSSVKPSLNNDDKKRLDSIKKELDRLKNEAKADAQDAAAVVKPGSLASDSDDDKTSSQNKPIEEKKKKPNISPPPPPSPKKSKGSSLNFLMILGPLFLVGALGFSYYNLKVKPQTPETYVAEKGKTPATYVFQKNPKSPDKITATCTSTEQTLSSGSITTCSDPIFEWQSEAKGFFVYFVSKLSEVELGNDSFFQTSKTFKPSNLKSDQTYYLFVQEASGQKNPLWTSKEKTGTIFKYIYE